MICDLCISKAVLIIIDSKKGTMEKWCNIHIPRGRFAGDNEKFDYEFD